MTPLQQQFVEFALESGVLRFGEFVTKAGRTSPYFFNAGLFNRGATLGRLARFYAQTLLAARDAGRVQFDLLFGPAYKGITLASSTAVAMAELGVDVPFAFNRKEAKDHGEGGVIVGAPLAGRVVIVDDVISAGTSVRESVQLIRGAGAEVAAVLIAIDRCERVGADDALSVHSAVQEVQNTLGVPVLAIATVHDLIDYAQNHVAGRVALEPHLAALQSYRSRYGV